MSDPPRTNADLPGSGLLQKGGRRTKIDDDLIKRAVQAVKAGSYVTQVAAFLGVSKKTWYEWRATGLQVIAAIDDEEIPEEELTEFEQMCGELWRQIQQAEAECEIRLVTQWNVAAASDWGAASKFLARRFKDRWAETSTLRTEISGPGGEPVEVRTKADIARAIAENPAALAMANTLLGEIVGASVPGMAVADASDNTDAEEDGDDRPDIGAVDSDEVYDEET